MEKIGLYGSDIQGNLRITMLFAEILGASEDVVRRLCRRYNASCLQTIPSKRFRLFEPTTGFYACLSKGLDGLSTMKA